MSRASLLTRKYLTNNQATAAISAYYCGVTFSFYNINRNRNVFERFSRAYSQSTLHVYHYDKC